MRPGKLWGAAALLIAISPVAAEPVALRNYNATIGETSISGLSSGGFMAVQFGTAWSSIVKGVGIIAGGPYWCAKADRYDVLTWYWGPIWRATGSCMKGPGSDLNVGDFIAEADEKAAAGEIDPLDNLKKQKIYLFHGYNDAVVAKAATDAARDFYRHYLGNPNRGNLFYQTTVGAGHSMVVTGQLDANGLNECQDNKAPYIDRCSYDQAGIILQHIYGRLNPPNRGQLAGSFKSFNQSIYTKPDQPDALSLGDTGHVFVPADCEQNGSACRVHIALHGCMQDTGEVKVSRRFLDHAGYNAWADTNHLIVLYPQTKSGSYSPYNPDACWDWWSYIDHKDSYVTKAGSQIKALKAMLDALTTGAGTPTDAAAISPIAPEGLAAVDLSDNGADLVWYPVPGATGYEVWRADAGGDFRKIADVIGASFGDSGLAPQSTYRWHVSAVVNGAEGPASVDISATTRRAPPLCSQPGSCPLNE
jgi:poly(3-hydroxybutyrate) depolymerase